MSQKGQNVIPSSHPTPVSCPSRQPDFSSSFMVQQDLALGVGVCLQDSLPTAPSLGKESPEPGKASDQSPPQPVVPACPVASPGCTPVSCLQRGSHLAVWKNPASSSGLIGDPGLPRAPSGPGKEGSLLALLVQGDSPFPPAEGAVGLLASHVG